MNASSDLGKKNISVESIAKKALEDEKVLKINRRTPEKWG
jgi:hypothetical protein